MDADLREIVAAQVPELMTCLQSLGVETCVDMRYLWKNAEACCRDVEAHAARDLSPTEAFGVVRAYTQASRVAAGHLDSQVQELVRERGSSQRDLRRPAEPLLPPSTIPPKVRKLIATGGPAEMPVARQLAAQSPVVKEQTMIQTKLDLVFRLAVEHFVDLESLGLSWSSLEDLVRLQQAKELLLGAAVRLSLDRLRILLAAGQRWRTYAAAQGFDARKPSPIRMAEFLAMVAKGGPTAASSMWHALLWWSRSYGLEWGLEHFTCVSFKMHAPGHRTVQAIELEPWEFVNLASLMVQAKGTNQVILAWFMMTALSCVRYEHLQRSKLVRDHGDWLEFYCSEGKARRKGSRPGYSWACPNFVWKGHHLAKLLADFFAHESENSGFLFPALELHASDLWEVHESTPMVTTRKLSRARFLELLRGAMLQAGLAPQHAASVHFNRLRRFTPTMGNLLKLSVPDMQSIGSWQEVPDGGGREGAKPKAVMHMGLHYSGQKLQRSAQVKIHIVKVLQELFAKKSPELALVDGLLTKGSWKWQDVAGQLEHQAPQAASSLPPLEDGSAVVEAPVELPVAAASEENIFEVDYEPDDDKAESSSSSDESKSASDVSADPNDLPGNLPCDEAMQEILWFVQGKKVHIVCDTVESCRYVPWCRESPFHQEMVRDGRRVGSLAADKICARCLSRMPRGLYLTSQDGSADRDRWYEKRESVRL